MGAGGRSPRRGGAVVEAFVDSGFWLAVFRRPQAGREPDRRAGARELLRRLAAERRRLVTTNLVVAEAHQLLLVRDYRGTALEFLRFARAPGLLVVASTPELEQRATADWIERYSDHDFSLCDAVSFVVMRERGIRQALTFDRHYAAAGFEMLP